jgi:uncharacterized protein (DUF4415 family)
MKEKQKNIKSDLKKSDRHTIQPKEYDELPELTDETLERAVYKTHGKEKPKPKRNTKKCVISLRLPKEVIDYFQSEGTNWQTKINHVLKNWIKHHPHSH